MAESAYVIPIMSKTPAMRQRWRADIGGYWLTMHVEGGKGKGEGKGTGKCGLGWVCVGFGGREHCNMYTPHECIDMIHVRVHEQM